MDNLSWTSNSDSLIAQFNESSYPVSPGYYDLGGVHLELDKKPRWLHRVMVRLVLGWKWVGS